jgi:hypothetical protein
MRDTVVKINPKISAFLGEILPDGIGLVFVLSIIASMSRSLYPVIVSAAADPAATPVRSKNHCKGVTSILKRSDAVRAAPNAVKTKRYHIFGFVNS